MPGLSESPHYRLEVREEGGESWLHPATLLSECSGETFCNTTGMFGHLHNWTNSYVNFEMAEGVRVEIRISKLTGDPVTKAVVHPRSAAASCEVREGEVYVVITKPVLFTVDINGQMDDQDTGKLPHTRGYYDGPPIHTLTIFANPFLTKPSLSDPGVELVSPGQSPPTDGAWHTLYFLPGIHDIGIEYRLQANRSYYIPGDAVVYGTLTSMESEDGLGVKIFGHGTISGDRLPHPIYSDTPQPEHWKYRPVSIKGAVNVTLEGITIANSAFHSVILMGGYDPAIYNEIRWLKIFTWRANGDGINPFGNTAVEDCFIRTQDDSSYVTGRGMRRVVFWQDSNGSTFVLTQLGSENINSHPLVIEDCTVVYSRSLYN